MRQIVDLQKASNFKALGVALVSIGTDPLSDLRPAAQEYGITTPLLSDKDGTMSRAYGVLQWAMPNGEPGHTFVLVGKDGTVKWIKDYGAPQDGGLMYVAVDELTQEIMQRLH
jgi:peroxiredoxin